MAPYVAMIHGIDSYKLLVEVNKQAKKCSRVIPCLLQIHIAEEETKFGFSFDECRKCSKKEIGKNCIISKSAASWVWQPISMTQNKLRKNFVP